MDRSIFAINKSWKPWRSWAAVCILSCFVSLASGQEASDSIPDVADAEFARFILGELFKLPGDWENASIEYMGEDDGFKQGKVQGFKHFYIIWPERKKLRLSFKIFATSEEADKGLTRELLMISGGAEQPPFPIGDRAVMFTPDPAVVFLVRTGRVVFWMEPIFELPKGMPEQLALIAVEYFQKKQ